MVGAIGIGGAIEIGGGAIGIGGEAGIGAEARIGGGAFGIGGRDWNWCSDSMVWVGEQLELVVERLVLVGAIGIGGAYGERLVLMIFELLLASYNYLHLQFCMLQFY